MTPWELAKSGSEAGEQRALMAWCNMAQHHGVRVANDPLAYQGLQARLNGIPQLKWLHAIHNQGHGDAIRGGIAKAEGVKAGVADLFLPYPMEVSYGPGLSRTFHGLYIEMKKAKGGVVSAAQREFAAEVINNGYQHKICNGWLVARDVLLEYLGLL